MYITLESTVSAGASSYVGIHAESSARRTLKDNSLIDNSPWSVATLVLILITDSHLLN